MNLARDFKQTRLDTKRARLIRNSLPKWRFVAKPLHGSDPEAVAEAVRSFGPVTITLGDVAIFPANETDAQRGGSAQDVVYVEVKSDRLKKLHDRLAQLERTSTHPTYIPHVCLGYCKPGEGQKYVGRSDVAGMQCHFTALVFSDKDKKRHEISLVPEAKPVKYSAWVVAEQMRFCIDKRSLFD